MAENGSSLSVPSATAANSLNRQQLVTGLDSEVVLRTAGAEHILLNSHVFSGPSEQVAENGSSLLVPSVIAANSLNRQQLLTGLDSEVVLRTAGAEQSPLNSHVFSARMAAVYQCQVLLQLTHSIVNNF